MDELRREVDRVAAETSFSGAVRVDREGAIDVAVAYGLAHRGWAIPNTVDTRFGIASGSKGLTALAVASLIEDGTLDWTTTARSVLGDDLPLIDDAVTVEQLLAHRSGIGDYLDEEAGNDIDEYVMPVAVHELATTEQFLAVLDGYPMKFRPDERFEYCNGGFVVLALIAERASGSAVPRPRRRAGLPSGRHVRQRLPPLRRAARRRRPRIPQERAADERVPPTGARQR